MEDSANRVNTNEVASSVGNFDSFVFSNRANDTTEKESKLIDIQEKRTLTGKMFMTQDEKDDLLRNRLLDDDDDNDSDDVDDDADLDRDVKRQGQRAVTNPAMLSSDQARAMMIESLK